MASRQLSCALTLDFAGALALDGLCGSAHNHAMKRCASKEAVNGRCGIIIAS